MKEESPRSDGLSARQAAMEILNRVSLNKADDLLDEQVSSFEDSRDRKLIQQLAYGALRQRAWLDWCLAQVNARSGIKVPEGVRNILRLGAFQILFCDRIPNYAAVSECVEICKRTGFRKQSGLVNALLRNLIRREKPIEPPPKDADFGRYISVKYSLPRWIVDRLLRMWPGPKVESFAQASLPEPPLIVRYAGTTDNAEIFEPHPWLQGACEVKVKTLVSEIPGYQEGLFQVQDLGAQMVPFLLDPQAGESILEVGSAPGGKTTTIAKIIGDGGRLYAVDNGAERSLRLQENLQRMGTTNVTTIVADAKERIPGLPESVDKALVDAPCSGLGTLRRRVDLKWRIQPNDIEKLAQSQKELMKSAAKYVKDGGVLVYSTCTVLDEENDEVVNSFLNKHPEWRVENAARYLPSEAQEMVIPSGAFQTLPDRDGMDGIYAVRLTKGKA